MKIIFPKTPRVFICSPYRPVVTTEEQKILKSESLEVLRQNRLAENLLLALAACAYAVRKGKFPLAPHVYFTRFLDDADQSERLVGMGFGKEWIIEADEVWVVSETVSWGMKNEIALADALHKPIRYFKAQDICSETDPLKYFKLLS